MKILITRARAQSADFGNALQQAGFEPVYFPVIEIRPAQDLSTLQAALAEIGRYAWVIFTSVNAVDVVFDHIAKTGTAISLFDNLKIAAIGPKTAAALRLRGIEPFFIPDEFDGEALLSGLGDLQGKWLLLPRAEIARKFLPEAISAAGGRAHEISVYQTLPAQPDPQGLEILKTGVEWITFTSPSTVQNFIQIARQNGLDPFKLPGSPKIACIGPVTFQAAEKEGFTDLQMAKEYTVQGLIEVIARFAK